MGEVRIDEKIADIVIQIIKRRDVDLGKEEEKLWSILQEFVNKNLYRILLDDYVIPPDEQASKIEEMRALIDEFKLFLLYPWLNGRTKVAFAGKFSSGKSSIINTLLEEEVLPTEVSPTTVIPTYITLTPNSEHDILIISRDGARIPFEKSFLGLLKHNKLNEFIGAILQKVIDYIVLNKGVDLVKDVIIIDTPGYNPGSIVNLDRELSMMTLQKSDIIFWTIDVNDGSLSKDSLEIIKEYKLDDDKKEFYIILNKVDRKSPRERERIRENLRKFIQKGNINCKDILLFSSKKKELADIEKVKKIIKNYSLQPKGIEILFKRLKELLENLHDEIMEKQKRFVEEKHDIYKQITEDQITKDSIKQAIIDSIEANFFIIAKHEVPWLDDDYYKIYEKDLEDFWKSLSEAINREIDFWEDLSEVINSGMQEISEKDRMINIYEKRIKDVRNIIKELENIEKEFRIKFNYMSSM